MLCFRDKLCCLGLAARILPQYYLRDGFRDRQAAGNLPRNERYLLMVHHQTAFSFLRYYGLRPAPIHNHICTFQRRRLDFGEYLAGRNWFPFAVTGFLYPWPVLISNSNINYSHRQRYYDVQARLPSSSCIQSLCTLCCNGGFTYRCRPSRNPDNPIHRCRVANNRRPSGDEPRRSGHRHNCDALDWPVLPTL